MKPLTLELVKEKLDTSILITEDRAKNKMFVFSIWNNEYEIYRNGIYVCGGQALEEIIEEYNNL